MTVQILIGDVFDKLAEMPSNSVDCVVTSPPYWGLRSYLPDDHPDKPREIGLERTLGEHLDVLVRLFDEVRRVMKPEGTLWINYGDCYATKPNGRSALDTKAAGNDDRTFRDKPFSTVGNGLKPKDLAMLPNRLAIELQKPRYCGTIHSESDRIWLAAMIDGEGSIYIHRQPAGTKTGRDGRRTQDNFCVGIAFTNCSEPIVRRFAAICGKDNIHRVEARGSNRRDHYHWRVTGNIAKGILREVYPHLVGKQQEARVAISCPPSGDQASASWIALKALHKTGESVFDAKPPSNDDLWKPGWWVRSEIVWGKPNPMPDSSGRYRPSTAHEKVWLLTKSANSYYDSEAVKMPAESDADSYKMPDGWDTGSGGHGSFHRNGREKGAPAPKKRRASANAPRHAGHICHTKLDETPRGQGRLLRNYEPDLTPIIPPEVWEIATAAFSEAHFATFPPALVVPCILAGCPVGGTVLDPFGGAGTTGLVADRLQRNAILIELNPESMEIAERRIDADRGGLLNAMDAA